MGEKKLQVTAASEDQVYTEGREDPVKVQDMDRGAVCTKCDFL